MKIGKSIHIDPGAIVGLVLSLVGAIPHIVASPSFQRIVPEKWADILILIGIVITASRGQVVRREQYRQEEVYSIPPTDLEK